MASALEREATTRRWRRVQAPLALDDHLEPEPDVAVVAGAARDYVGAYPSLREYWIVNLVERTIEVHREPGAAINLPDDWSYRSIDVLRPPATVTPLAAPVARIPVADLLP
jgi:Uma2 family endonuclease